MSAALEPTSVHLAGNVLRLVCPHCGKSSKLPGDWAIAHRHERIGCPHCALAIRLPRLEPEAA